MARLARSADEKGVQIPCAVCRNPFAKLRLHRVGHRMLCATCFRSEKRQRRSGGPGLTLTQPDFASLERLNRGIAFTGIALKTVVFLLLFWWASRSPTGDAALHGVLIADVFTFVVFSLLNWHFRQLPITVGAIFEIVLVVLFANRHALLQVPDAGTVSYAIALGFFMLVLLVKSIAWWAEHVLEATGIKERASP